LWGAINYANLYIPSNNPYHDVCLAIADTSDGDENMIQQIVSGNYQSPQYNEETNWWMQYQLYIRALNDADLTNQFSLQQFIEYMQQAAAGKLENIAAQLSDSTGKDSLGLQQLKAQNQAINALNIIEEQFKWVNDKTIDAAIAELDDTFTSYNFNTTDMETLEALAWDCPKSSGPGVFSMRVLANKLDTVWVNYNNDCEQPPNVNEERSSIYYAQAADNEDETHDYDFLNVNDNDEVIESLKIYPNPNTGSFFINLENVNPSQVVVNVYNALGQNIEAQVQNVTGTIISVDINKQPKGLYIVEILSNQKIVGRTKLSISE
jgi:hypothetical protein